MIVVVDGPEKSGKSTMIADLVKTLSHDGVETRVRKWGKVFPDDRVYLGPLSEDIDDVETVSIWDRSWASEHVYGKLLNRDRRLSHDSWLGEWLYGRAVQAAGVRVMLTADPEELQARRDDTDLPVEPMTENNFFKYYGTIYGWSVQSTDYDLVKMRSVVDNIVSELNTSYHAPSRPPAYAGPRRPRVAFVGEARSTTSPQLIGSWLPFTSRYTTEFARLLSKEAFSCGWTNCHEIAPQNLRDVPIIVSCGKIAESWVRNYVILKSSSQVHLSVPHPSWVYRYNNAETLLAKSTIEEVMSILSRWLANNSDYDYLLRSALRHKMLVRA
jgi:hypothetical protein